MCFGEVGQRPRGRRRCRPTATRCRCWPTTSRRGSRGRASSASSGSSWTRPSGSTTATSPSRWSGCATRRGSCRSRSGCGRWASRSRCRCPTASTCSRTSSVAPRGSSPSSPPWAAPSWCGSTRCPTSFARCGRSTCSSQLSGSTIATTSGSPLGQPAPGGPGRPRASRRRRTSPARGRGSAPRPGTARGPGGAASRRRCRAAAGRGRGRGRPGRRRACRGRRAGRRGGRVRAPTSGSTISSSARCAATWPTGRPSRSAVQAARSSGRTTKSLDGERQRPAQRVAAGVALRGEHLARAPAGPRPRGGGRRAPRPVIGAVTARRR